MNKKCSNCGLVNFSSEEICRRCQAQLADSPVSANDDTSKKLDRAALWFIKRFLSAVVIAALILSVVYLSLLYSAEPLSAEQQAKVERAIEILDEKGFTTEVFLLRHTVSYRSTDNWFNQLTRHENAYAATNFSFQIVTLYESFFLKTVDDTERAMILLHEAQHLKGAGEPDAYEFVWRNRKALGWTRDVYQNTKAWANVSESTRLHAPQLFHCDFNASGDCTE